MRDDLPTEPSRKSPVIEVDHVIVVRPDEANDGFEVIFTLSEPPPEGWAALLPTDEHGVSFEVDEAMRALKAAIPRRERGVGLVTRVNELLAQTSKRWEEARVAASRREREAELIRQTVERELAARRPSRPSA